MSDQLANVQAALIPHAERLVVPEAGPQLASLLAQRLGGVDPALVAGAVGEMVKSSEFAHFFKPTGPIPGSMDHYAVTYDAAKAAMGGTGGQRDANGRINLAGTMTSRAEAGTSAAQQAAAQQAAAWAAIPPLERLERLGDDFRRAMAAQNSATGIILRQKS